MRRHNSVTIRLRDNESTRINIDYITLGLLFRTGDSNSRDTRWSVVIRVPVEGTTKTPKSHRDPRTFRVTGED